MGNVKVKRQQGWVNGMNRVRNGSKRQQPMRSEVKKQGRKARMREKERRVELVSNWLRDMTVENERN